LELHTLSLFEGPVSTAFDVREVHEDVVCAFTCDEAEALLGVEPLDGTCCHLSLFSPRPAGAAGTFMPRYRLRGHSAPAALRTGAGSAAPSVAPWTASSSTAGCSPRT